MGPARGGADARWRGVARVLVASAVTASTVAAGLLLTACGGQDGGPQAPASATGSPPGGSGPAGPGAAPTSATSSGVAASGPPDQVAADRLAGVLSRHVPLVGTGVLAVVPGVAGAPGGGRVWQVRVSVEGGLPVDGEAFVSMVMATLNDPRGWSRDGITFARTGASSADVEVALASPDTSARLCRPLRTFGRLSCRNGDRAILTFMRWAGATEDYAGDVTGYRRYVVNHEVGHALGHGHVPCPAAGALAPVMMQQTKGLDGCAPNPWPYP